MCIITIPPLPLLLPPWPWEEPALWISFGILVLLVGVYFGFDVRALRRQGSAWKRRVGWPVLVLACLCALVGGALFFLVAWSGTDALAAWKAVLARASDTAECLAVWQPLAEQRELELLGIRSIALLLLGAGLLLMLARATPALLHSTPQPRPTVTSAPLP
jgi:hypothetical protein